MRAKSGTAESNAEEGEGGAGAEAVAYWNELTTFAVSAEPMGADSIWALKGWAFKLDLPSWTALSCGSP